MVKKIYKKLVRDKIPEIIIENNGKPKSVVLSDKRYLKELNKKLVEESRELQEASSKEDVLNELADVYELILSLAKANNLQISKVISAAAEKRKRRGSFKKKVYLEYVEEN